MSLKVKFLLACVSTVLLTACDSEAIKQVKESVNYNIDSTLTAGKAFETRSDCVNGSWEEGKDNRDRVIVSYHCELTPEALTITNDELQKRVAGTFSNVNNNLQFYLKNNSAQLKEAQDNFAFYDKVSKILATSEAQLREAFKKDEVIANHLPFNTYLATMLGLSYMGGYAPTLDTACSADGSNRNSDVDENYIAESCKKNIYPVYASYKQAIEALDREKQYDFFRNLYRSAEEYKYDDSDVGKILLAEIEEYKQRSNKTLQKTPQVISELQSQIADNVSLFENLKADFAVRKVVLTQNWIVSDTGGVDIIDGSLTAQASDRELNVNLSGGTLMPFAYHDYEKNEMPSFYLIKVKSLFDQQLEGFRRQLKQ